MSTPGSFINWNAEPQIEPRVFEEREFREIAEDFSNPCEIFREAISNAFDAKATEIEILLSIIKKGSKDILRIEIGDNGRGMNRQELQAFFDLGNSTSKNDPAAIGEKGHGTKIYYKSSRIEVTTTKEGAQLRAEVTNPYDALANEQKPAVQVFSRPDSTTQGTRITIDDYNHSIRDKFTHDNLKDYILWFTKFGSIEKEFDIASHKDTILRLRGVDRSEQPEVLRFGHVFPQASQVLDKLLDEYKHDAPDYFVRKWKHSGTLKNFPDISWQAIFFLEGDSAKRNVNQMIRGKGRKQRAGMYSVQERYGLWLCKDRIPIQRMNEWITVKGTEYTKFHAFVNCQSFRLTANRGSVMNTPPEILDDIHSAVTAFYKEEIIGSKEFSDLEWLEGQAAAYISQEKDEQDFERRLAKLPQRRVAHYKDAELIEPSNEVGVLALVTTLLTVDRGVFPFRLLDYTTYRGYDALATLSRDDLPLEKLSKAYIEFKYSLQRTFNHLFKHLSAIVCWQLDAADGEKVVDIGENAMKLKIIPGNKSKKEHTRYWLEDDYRRDRIEVFVLSEYLPERFGITFNHRGHP